MARIRLHEQPSYEFTYHFAVQARDLSSRRHLGSDAIVQLMHEALVNLFQTIGLTEFDLGDGNTGVIAEDTVINFMSESFLSEVLTIETHVDEVTSSGFRVFHRMDRSGKIIALAEMGLIGFDYANRTPAPIPGAFNTTLLRYTSRVHT